MLYRISSHRIGEGFESFLVEDDIRRGVIIIHAGIAEIKYFGAGSEVRLSGNTIQDWFNIGCEFSRMRRMADQNWFSEAA